VRRSERLIRVTKWLIDRPNHPVSLSELSAELDAAKSSLSEDVAMIRDVLERDGQGTIHTIQGAGGGVKYQAHVSDSKRNQFMRKMAERLIDPSRILPGGFIYMSDVLGDPDVLDVVGAIFAEAYAESGVNVVVTVETKGIPLAVATARYLHVPVVVVRREHRVTDGSALSMHYVTGSARRIQTMSISKRAMPAHAHALVVDDFMRAGATAKAVVNLLAEFEAEVVGTAVFVSTLEPQSKLIDDYLSVFRLGLVEESSGIQVVPTESLLK
jgi:purine operon repressor